MKTFHDTERRRWQVELISHGRTSGYLNPRVHQPVLQFSCLDASLARRYIGYPGGEDGLMGCSEQELRELLARAAAH